MILEHKHRTSTSSTHLSAVFWLFIIGLIALGMFTIYGLRQTEVVYDQTAKVLSSSDKSIKKFTLADTDQPLYLVDPGLIRPGNIWGLTSKYHPLPDKFTPGELIETSVPRGGDEAMKVQKHIESPLRTIFAAAEEDGVELMLSSAYRSIEDQRALYDDFVAEQGEAMAKIYVAQPQTSEHHTGLSIDFSTASAACEEDSDACSLSQADAAWLDENAPRFGFIQRYPEGKQPITGVGFEPWHYRYVGVPLAKAIKSSGLTMDEAIEQMAPGLKSRNEN